MISRHAASRFTALFFSLMFAFAALPAGAAPTVNVDARVAVEFGPMIVGQTVKTYRTDAVVTNTSNSDILGPVRLLISNIDKNNTRVANADGIAAGGVPFVEVELDDGVLSPGESSLPTTLEFVRQVGNAPTASKGNGKTKKPGFPTFGFDHSVEGGAAVALGKPSSVPFALKPGPGSTSVAFSVGAVTDGATYGGNVLLHGPGLGAGVAMDDSDGDGIFTAQQVVDRSGLGGGDCLAYTASTEIDGGDVVVSPVYNLCATNFPLVVAESNTSPDNLVVIANTPAVGNEVLVFFTPGTPDSQVQELLKRLGGEVAGTLLPQGLYQIRLPAVQSARELQQLIDQASNFPGVTGAGANHVGEFTSIPNDPEFPSQHAMQLVSADNLGAVTPKYVWDANATGGGITVLVLDSGIDASHPDLAPLPENTAGDNTDTLGHGTEMGGIIAATTNNMIGIAGMARDASLQSIKIGSMTAVSETQMLSGLTTALPLAGPNAIVNASFSIFGLLKPTVNLCSAINDLIVAGAVVVNSAGNDGVSTDNVWPGNCNTPNPALQAFLGSNVIADPNKPSFIVVAASNCSAGACAADTRKADSNHGSWVDIAAPGVNVRATTIGGGYTNSNGTSAAAALTSGAAAILRSCGVANTSVFSVLDLGATVTVTPDFNRINLYNSLASLNTTPTGVGLAGGAIDENIDTTGGVSVGTLSATDSTACDAHTFSIGGADAGSFLPVGAGNQLELDAGVLDFESKSSYDITVQATDFYGNSTGAIPFTINVNDVNEPPTIAPQARSIDENEPFGTNVGAPIVASDPDAGATWTFAITGGNTGGAFAISPAGQITVANQAALDFETNPVFNLTVEVTDNGSLTDSATITVTLNDVFEPIPNPILVFDTFIDYETDPGQFFRRWEFNVTNFAAFPAELFVQTADYGPCGLNATPSRSWVDYFDAGPDGLANTGDDVRLFGFCALGNPASMNGTWFARPRPGGTGAAVPPPPAGVYMKIIDRATSAEYISNVVTGLPNPSIP